MWVNLLISYVYLLDKRQKKAFAGRRSERTYSPHVVFGRLDQKNRVTKGHLI